MNPVLFLQPHRRLSGKALYAAVIIGLMAFIPRPVNADDQAAETLKAEAVSLERGR